MAKMFYDLEETAKKLGKSKEDVREMASKGELQEFRDGDKLIFKVDQVDLLAGDDDSDAAEMSSMIPLADTGMGTSIGDSSASGSGSGSGVAGGGDESSDDFDLGGDFGEEEPSASSGSGSAGKTGISVFDVDDTEEADPAAQTQVSDIGSGGLSIESLGSGSGLMDLTRESDDTSLGAEGLLDDIYADEDATGGGGFSETSEMGADESGLFEGGDTSGASDIEAETAPAGMVAAEPYDGTWSGITGGLMLATILSLLAGMSVMIMSIVMGEAPDMLLEPIGGNILIAMGALAGAAVLFALIGFVVGKKG